MRYLAALFAILAGCRTVTVDRSSDGAWHARYVSYGLWTSLGRLEVDVQTNGAVAVRMNDLGSDMSTNHAGVVRSSGAAVGAVAGEAVKAAVR